MNTSAAPGRPSARRLTRPIRVLVAALLVMPMWALIGPQAAQAAPDPVTCQGYPEWRTPLEAQSWWVDDANPFPGQHIHMQTCFPLHQTVSGVVHFDVKIMSHNVPGTVTKLAVEAFGNGSIQSKPLSLSCQVVDCAWTVPFDFDTTKTNYNGRWEFRMRAIVSKTPNGNTQYNSTRWHATIDNPGKPVKNGSESTSRTPGGAGWYTGIGYMNVFCGSGGYDLVRRPVSGKVSLSCKFDKQTAFASVDASFHANPPNPGTVLLDSSTGGTKTITIDTTKLTNGLHRLFLRTDAKGTSPAGTGSGVQAFMFEVQN